MVLLLIADKNTTDSFKFKDKIAGQKGNDGTKNAEIMVPLKYLKCFSKTLKIPINCKINLILTWTVEIRF